MLRGQKTRILKNIGHFYKGEQFFVTFLPTKILYSFEGVYLRSKEKPNHNLFCLRGQSGFLLLLMIDRSDNDEEKNKVAMGNLELQTADRRLLIAIEHALPSWPLVDFRKLCFLGKVDFSGPGTLFL